MCHVLKGTKSLFKERGIDWLSNRHVPLPENNPTFIVLFMTNFTRVTNLGTPLLHLVDFFINLKCIKDWGLFRSLQLFKKAISFEKKTNEKRTLKGKTF